MNCERCTRKGPDVLEELRADGWIDLAPVAAYCRGPWLCPRCEAWAEAFRESLTLPRYCAACGAELDGPACADCDPS